MNLKKILLPTFLSWLPLAFTITALSGLIFVTAQQVYRQSANDPQAQMVEDFSAQIANGAPVDSLNNEPKVDLEKSATTFITIFDKNGKLLASNATLKGETPLLPDGVLAYTKVHGMDQVTWQPQKNVRIALVVKHFKGTAEGYIAVGKSIRLVEERVQKLTLIVAIGWAVTIIVSFVLTLLINLLSKKNKTLRKE